MPIFAANSVKRDENELKNHNSFNIKSLQNGRKEIFDM